jgi:hypothetical protein
MVGQWAFAFAEGKAGALPQDGIHEGHRLEKGVLVIAVEQMVGCKGGGKGAAGAVGILGSEPRMLGREDPRA